MIAGFFSLFALPTFIFLKERSTKKQLPEGKKILKSAFSDLIKTFRNPKENKNLLIFLIALFFFSCGIAIVFTFSAIYAKQELGFEIWQLMVLIISVNLLASLGAFTFGYVQDKIGAKPTIIITLIIWCAVIIGIVITQSKIAFFTIGIFVGLSLGSTQSASRAMIGLLTSEGRFGEDYGLWGLSTKFAAIIGTFTFGLLVYLTKSRRIAVLVTLGFFIFGLLALLPVKTKKDPHFNG
jgi:UMF1 family MFS transporter